MSDETPAQTPTQTPSRILVVDDTPRNLRLMEAMLTGHGHEVVLANSGEEALEIIAKECPDVVLLDVVMPGLGGYEVCRRIRERPETRLLPVVMLTALDPEEERVKAIEAGADDFLERPVRQAELHARVRSLLRIKALHEQVAEQAQALAEWNRTLEERVQGQVDELERLGRLKRFLAPQVAEALVRDGEDAASVLQSHRRHISVVFIDLRGYTSFISEVEPEELMGMLHEFHAEMGRLVVEHEGTLERFTGDGMMVFFNDPVEIPDPEGRAVRMAIEMRDALATLRIRWERRGYPLDMGIGIAAGYATLGAIGFEGRFDYAAIGKVTNLAARLCDAAPPAHILVSKHFLSFVHELVDAEPIGELELKGFPRAVTTYNIVRRRSPA